MAPTRRLRARASVALSGAIAVGLVLTASPAAADDSATPPAAAAEQPSQPTVDQPAAPTPPQQDPAVVAVVDTRLPLREGAVGSRVRVAQKRLQWLGYEVSSSNASAGRMGPSTVAAVRAFQEKFGYRPTGVVGPGTWELLELIAGRVGRVPAACRGAMTICIDKSQRLVRLVEDGRVVLTLDARFGFVGAETREGSYRVHSKSRDHVSSLYRTWMPFALFFAGGQAVHYSPYFARDGYNGGSHGCVNLRDYDRARWLFDHVPVGTRVHVYR